MAHRAMVIALRGRHRFGPNDFQVFGLSIPGSDADADMLGRRAMAGFAVDTRLLPGGVIRFSYRIVIAPVG